MAMPTSRSTSNTPQATILQTTAPSLLKQIEVRKRCGNMSNSGFYNLRNPHSPYYDPDFPEPIKLSPRGINLWLASDIDDYIINKARKAPQKGERK